MNENSPIVTRHKQIIRTSIVGIITNVLLAGFKAFVGVLSNSIAITLDAVNNLTDALSSVITITIDGKQLISCGDTCVFYDTRLVPEHEFYLDEVESTSSGIMDTTLVSGKLNSVKNKFGKPMVVVIKSQMGAPIYAFSGKKVYWEIQEDLPRFTKLMIDGKALYIHRANFQIIDKSLLD